MTGGGSEDITWPGLSGLFRNALERSEHYGTYNSTSVGRAGERVARSVGRDILIYDK